MPGEIVTAHLGEEELAHVDRLARERGVDREAMLAALVASGLAVCEEVAREAPTPLRSSGSAG